MKKLIYLFVGLFVITNTSTALLETYLPPDYKSGDFGCSSVTFTYYIEFALPFGFRIVDENDQVVSSTLINRSSGTPTVTIHLSPEQPQGTVLQIQHDFFGGWNDFGPATACAGDGNDNKYIAPPWEYFGGQDAHAAFRFLEDNTGNPVLIFLRVNNNGDGSIAFYISEKMLEQDFPCTDDLVQIYTSDDGLYQLWRLPDCQLQANVGPDAEGKIHVVGFSEIPPTDAVYSYTLVARQPLSLFASIARIADMM